MEKLKEIYDEISNFNSFGWSLDFSSLYDSIIAKLNGEPEPPREKVLTKGEKYINNAIKVNKLDLFEGTIIVPKKDYISGYHNLSFDEFCSYIYETLPIVIISKSRTVFGMIKFPHLIYQILTIHTHRFFIFSLY